MLTPFIKSVADHACPNSSCGPENMEVIKELKEVKVTDIIYLLEGEVTAYNCGDWVDICCCNLNCGLKDEQVKTNKTVMMILPANFKSRWRLSSSLRHSNAVSRAT